MTTISFSSSSCNSPIQIRLFLCRCCILLNIFLYRRSRLLLAYKTCIFPFLSHLCIPHIFCIRRSWDLSCNSHISYRHAPESFSFSHLPELPEPQPEPRWNNRETEICSC